MKKPVRLLLVAATASVVAAAVVVGLALNAGVQTWAARRALAGQAGIKADLGRVSAGFQAVELKDLRLERDGAVVQLPALLAELSVLDAGLSRKIAIRRLVAKGWTLDLRKYKFPTAPRKTAGLEVRSPGFSRHPTALAAKAGATNANPLPRSFSLVPSAYAAEPAVTATATAAATRQVFAGIFDQAALPFDLALDGVEIEGDVLLPPAPGVETGRARVVLAGGGFAAGREGAFSFSVAIGLTGANAPVTALEVSGRLAATMDTPRTFVRLGTKAGAAATGPQFPRGVKLATDLSAVRDSAGENYSIHLHGEGRPLAAIAAALPKATRRLDGTWKLDARDADLSPFTLGRALPAFTVAGEGRFDTDPAFGEIHATGKLAATADRLAVVQPELAAIGAVQLRAEFDLAQRGDTVRVERLTAALAGAQPVARVEALQTFEFNLTTRQLKVADPARELLGLALDGLPLAWAQPWLKDVTLSGGNLRGEIAATARNDGVSLRAKSPLTAAGVTIVRAGQPVLRAVEVSLLAGADYAPHGWQAEVSPLVLRQGETLLGSVEARVGQLAGKDQPIKIAGRYAAQLPALLAQPFARGAARLTGGEAAGTFATETLNGRQAVHATISLTALAADPKLTTEKLPTIGAEMRADFAATGPITINLPIAIERDGRNSDLTFAGTLLPGKDGLAVNAQLTSTQLFVDDAKILAAPLAAGPDVGSPGFSRNPSNLPAEAGATNRIAAAPWAGLSGQIALALKKVVYGTTAQATDVSGTIRIDAGALKLVNARAGLGQGSEAKAAGGLTFDARAAAPFALEADVAVNEFDPAPWLLALNPRQPATVEGKFTVSTKVSGRAASLAALAEGAHGSFQLTSKGGKFRGLPVGFATKTEAAGKIAAVSSILGNALGAVTGRKDASDIAGKAQAVAEFAALLGAIPYDQLSVVLERDAALNTQIKDFALLSPEMRLTGAGRTTHRTGASLLEDALALEFKLRARGRTAELLKYLGRLDPPPDELGYAACTLPLKVGGTLAKIDTSELNTAIAALAIEKSGAGELLNKLRGGGKE